MRALTSVIARSGSALSFGSSPARKARSGGPCCSRSARLAVALDRFCILHRAAKAHTGFQRFLLDVFASASLARSSQASAISSMTFLSAGDMVFANRLHSSAYFL